jgi:hypothetical protein
MPRITEALLDDILIVYMAVFAVAAAFNWLYRRRLRDLHPEAWRSIGSPQLFNNTIANGISSSRYLLGRKYESLNDETLSFYGRWTRYGFLSILAFLALFFALILIGQIQNGVWDHPKITVTVGGVALR